MGVLKLLKVDRGEHVGTRRRIVAAREGESAILEPGAFRASLCFVRVHGEGSSIYSASTLLRENLLRQIDLLSLVFCECGGSEMRLRGLAPAPPLRCSYQYTINAIPSCSSVRTRVSSGRENPPAFSWTTVRPLSSEQYPSRPQPRRRSTSTRSTDLGQTTRRRS